jgi:hypothetical protein
MPDLQSIKVEIWTHRKVNKSPSSLQVYADRASVRLPITQVHEAQKLLDSLNRRKKKAKAQVPPDHYRRYRDAKYAYQSIEFPAWVKDGHFIEPDMPDVSTSNGLTNFIIDHATWMGCHGNRINTTGRKVGDKWITGTTKKGTADVSLIVQGRSIHLEIKVGKDQPRPEQLKQQTKIRAAGGVYEFIHDTTEYFAVFDRYYSKQGSIFDAT